MQWFGAHPEEWGYFKIIGLEGTPLTRIDGVMIIGMFGGCIMAALWANNVKLRHPQHKVRILQAVLGGIIAGFGARLAMGCNLAAFFTGIPQCLVLCCCYCYWLLFWCQTFINATISYTGKTAKSQ